MLILPSHNAQRVPPPGSVVDWSHPLAGSLDPANWARNNRGLALLLILNQRSLIIPNLAMPGTSRDGGDKFAIASTMTFAGGKAGPGFYCDGSANSNIIFNPNSAAGYWLNM